MGKQILLVSPKIFQFHGLNYTQDITGKYYLPPLAMLTVAGLIPRQYSLRLVDENVRSLTDQDISWADVVLMTGLTPNEPFIKAAAERCRQAGKHVILGGCHATLYYDEIDYVDTVVVGEAELLMEQLLNDIDNQSLKPLYRSCGFNDMVTNPPPLPRYDLIDFSDYIQQNIQFSKGCVFSCEFCDVASISGVKQRAKSVDRFIEELDHLFSLGYRGILNITDENLITAPGVRRLFTQVRDWQRERGYPFDLHAYGISINLAFNDGLMQLARDAGLRHIFIGLETPVKESLLESMKLHNTKRDMLQSVHKLQKNGFIVVAGFMVGFDSDPDDVGDQIIDFIQEAGLPMFTLNYLHILKGSPLYDRMQAEGRYLTSEDYFSDQEGYWNGFGGQSALNFIPKMGQDKLLQNYTNIAYTLFDERAYFERCESFLSRYVPADDCYKENRYLEIGVAFARFLKLIMFTRYHLELVKFMWRVAKKYPEKLTEAIVLGVSGYSLIVEREELKRVFSGQVDSATRGSTEPPQPLSHAQ